MSDPNLTIDDLNALPERMRAHAAAKAVGMTSREFLTAMAGIGVEIKSAQSGVTREVLLTWFTSRGQDSAAAATGADTTPVVDAPGGDRAADTTAAGGDRAPAAESVEPASAADVPAKKAAPRKTAEKKTAAKKSPARKPTAEKTAEKATGAEKSAARTADRAGSGGGAGTARADRPPLPEIAIVTGEVGSAEPSNRRRRSTATPSFSPLFLSPEDTAAQAEVAARSARSGRTARDQSGDESRASAGRPAEESRGRAAADQPGTTGRGDSADREDTDTEDQQGTRDRGTSADGGDQGEGGDAGSRRRRRGRRGRGRGRGENGDEQNGENTGTDEGADATDSDDTDPYSTDTDRADRGDTDRDDTDREDTDESDSDGSTDGADERDDSEDDSSDDSDDTDDSEGASSGSRRRRRRRRRGGGGSGSDDTQAATDDPPHTEIHEREPRRRSGRGGQAPASGTSSDEVQGITGSTRLEAKRQRRRDGREAGRRRQPILSESEFLARRESVDRVMVVREKLRADGHGIMTQVGVLEDKVLVEHFVTTESARSMVGNVYLGRVQNVLPSMEAAFVDIGRGRNGVLYAGEVNWEAAGLGGKARRIEQALKPGDMVLVQVTKDPVGQKGARLSTQISLAGRFLVYVPDGNSTGISRKLPDTERRRLKAILKEVVPEGSGVIIRTAAEGVSAEEIGRDVERLSAQWTEIAEAADKRTGSGSGTPVALYEEPDLLVKVVRDLFNEDFSKLVIQGDTSWDTVHDYVSRVAPEMAERLERYDNPGVDVFATYRVDEQLAKALDRKVWLPSGGSLVIDRTEAMTVIDVNTGKYTGSGGNLEETVTKNNLEAAEEIVRQLRLRDIGGMVIIDFIDMVLESNRDLVLRRLTEALGRDRTRHQVSEVTSLGLVQLTRKKLGTGLVEAFSTPCEECQGRGLIIHADPVHTESHNADEPGGRRGKRRGGNGSTNGKGSGEPDAPAPKQTPRKDGPAPAAHPAALAISRQEAAKAEADEAARVARNAEADEAQKADESAADRSAGASTGSGRTSDESATTGKVAVEAVTAEVAPVAAESSPQATETAPEPGVADSADAAGTRPGRRRRASRRPASGAAPTTAVQDAAAAEPAETPQAETEVAAEASQAVEAVDRAEPTADQQSERSEQPVVAGQESTGSSGRRPRRRSTRREAGAAGGQSTSASEAAPASAAPATAAPATAAPASTAPETRTDSAATAAPVAVAPVEAAPLAQEPTAVVPEPRKRPARRRATRTTTAPEGGRQ